MFKYEKPFIYRVSNGNIKMKYFTANRSVLGDETWMRFQCTVVVSETCIIYLNSCLKLMVPSNAVNAAKDSCLPSFHSILAS